MVNAYVGNPYKLVFPLFSNGHLLLNYDDAVTQVETPNDDTNTPTADTIATTRDRSLWSNTGSFTIECIITPYDVNGSAKDGSTEFGVLDSTKTPPYPSDSLSNRASTYESTSILGTSSSTKYTTSPRKMMIFHNANVKLYLQNTTDNSYNQPAEYKVVAEFRKTGGTFRTIETDTIIKAENKLTGYYDAYGYYVGNRTSLTKLDTATASGSVLTLGTAINSKLVGIGTELFDNTGTSIGLVVSINTGAGTITMDRTQTNTTVYYSQKKEALYLDQMYKISFTYLRNAAEIYVNNALQVSEQHVESEVTLDPSDCKIGQGTTSEQFYGEIYEIAMHSGNSPNISTTKTLSPSYSNILFYYRFGE